MWCDVCDCCMAVMEPWSGSHLSLEVTTPLPFRHQELFFFFAILFFPVELSLMTMVCVFVEHRKKQKTSTYLDQLLLFKKEQFRLFCKTGFTQPGEIISVPEN